MDKCGWEKVVSSVKPDVIHIHGTEFPHGLRLMKACPKEKYVVSIQGLVGIYAIHYCAALPYQVVLQKSFRDILKRGGILSEQKQFFRKGQTEAEMLRSSQFVIGRTTWDMACSRMINPSSQYFHCNESLRSSFYQYKWDLGTCKKHTVFISQATYPIKGLHMALQAFALVLKDYPDAHLYIAGRNITEENTFRDRLKKTHYAKYIKKLIQKLDLGTKITFTGPLSEQQMCEYMIRSHVCFMPSSIENSPNSLGEAMLLGVPSVASDVGGVADLMVHKREGFIYPFDEYYMAAYYIKQIFEDSKLATLFSENGRRHARKTHDSNQNLNDLLQIYEQVYKS